MLYTIFTNVAITKIKFKTFVILNTNFLAKKLSKNSHELFSQCTCFLGHLWTVVKNVMLYNNIFTNVAITKIKFKTFVILNTNFQTKNFLKTPSFFLLFYLSFLSRTSMIHRTAVKGEGYLVNSSPPLLSA